jgi:hypothetical protein
MIPLLLSALRCCRTLCLCLLAVLPLSVAAEILPEDGPVGFEPKSYPGDREWLELGSELPPWPERNRLIEVDIDSTGRGYRLYIDPQSVTTGKDRVVRFTSVMVPPSGIWNVTYEGLHCGKQTHRRFAYGMNERWYELPNSAWSRLARGGINQYRSFLYNYFMCNPAGPHKDADDIVRSLRSAPSIIGD